MNAWLKKYARKIAGTIAILSMLVVVVFMLAAKALIVENLSEVKQEWIGPDHYFVAFADNEGHFIAKYEGDIEGKPVTIEVPPNAFFFGIDDGGNVDNELWWWGDEWVETCWDDLCPRWYTIYSKHPNTITIQAKP